jgi:hypothetical protein
MWISNNQTKHKILPSFILKPSFNTNIMNTYKSNHSPYIDLSELYFISEGKLNTLTFSLTNHTENLVTTVDNSDSIIYSAYINKVENINTSNNILNFNNLELTNITDNNYLYQGNISNNILNNKKLDNLYIFRNILSSDNFNIYITYKFSNVNNINTLKLFLNSKANIDSIYISSKSYNFQNIPITLENLFKTKLTVDTSIIITFKYNINFNLNLNTNKSIDILNYKVNITEFKIHYYNPLNQVDIYNDFLNEGVIINYLKSHDNKYFKSVNSYENINSNSFIDSENACIVIV